LNQLKQYALPLVGLFLGGYMDQIEAEKNIKRYVAELCKYNNLDRSLLSRDEMIMIDNKIIALKERIKFLRSNP